MFINTVKSLVWADFFIYSLTDPRALARLIRTNEPRSFMLSFLSPVLAAIACIISSSVISSQSGFFYYKITYGWILFSMISILQILIYSSLTSFSLEFTGKKSSIKEIITLSNFAQFPVTFLMPLVYIFSVIHFAPIYFLLLFWFSFIVWSLFISTMGISEFYNLSFSKALFAYLFPYLLISVSGFFILILIAVNIIGLAIG
jgi:hypothetical protein